MRTWKFLSTLSLRRATAIDVFLAVWAVISIHALLAESDNRRPIFFGQAEEFLSTLSLRRATMRGWFCPTAHPLFLSTLSLRRATTATKGINRNIAFLSTLSLRRATLVAVFMICLPRDFYPRSPCGERRQVEQTCRVKISISIHALLAESDRRGGIRRYLGAGFLSTLSLRRATDPGANSRAERQISIHALLAESDSSFRFLWR